jgi:DNA (cytosine-5)-methyltransferase 3A
MNVLSLFDGCSGAQQAFERLGVRVDNYFASEIDKYAIQVTMANYPNTVQLGSVIDVDVRLLPKIDLLCGGSPCQSFSFAGKRKGMSTKDSQEILTLNDYLKLKSEGFEFEGQSYLFWEYMRVLEDIRMFNNPDVRFMLENVEMGEKWEKVLSKAIGVNGNHINSALVSAQNRKRIYWCNFGVETVDLFNGVSYHIPQPKDRGILLKDILENDVDDKYYLSEKMIAGFERHKERHIEKGTGFVFNPTEGNKKSAALRANAALCPTDNSIIVHNTMPRSSKTGKGGTGPLSREDGKTYCLDTGNTNAIEIVAMQGRPNGNGINVQQLEYRHDNKTNSLTSVQKDNLVVTKNYIQWEGYAQDNRAYFSTGKSGTIDTKTQRNKVIQLNQSKESGGQQPFQQNRVYSDEGVMTALDTDSGRKSVLTNSRIRRLTPLECMRLQTIRDDFNMPVSDSQKYKIIGNGWTIEVVAHIFSFLKKR